MNDKKEKQNQFPLKKIRNCMKKILHNMAKCLAIQRRCKQSIIGEKGDKATRTIKARK